MIDFSDNNGHQDLDSGVNGATGLDNYSADERIWATGTFSITDDYWPDDSDLQQFQWMQHVQHVLVKS